MLGFQANFVYLGTSELSAAAKCSLFCPPATTCPPVPLLLPLKHSSKLQGFPLRTLLVGYKEHHFAFHLKLRKNFSNLPLDDQLTVTLNCQIIKKILTLPQKVIIRFTVTTEGSVIKVFRNALTCVLRR